MDRKKEFKIPGSPDVPDLTGYRTVVGARQLRKALQSGSAKRVYLARNADPAMTQPIEALCSQLHIPYFWVRTMQDLGQACGIDVGAAAAAVVN